MPSREPIKLRDLLSLRPDEVKAFVAGLAEREPWALAAIDRRSGDHPFDRLAAYWTAASQETRLAMSDGVREYLEASCRNPDKIPSDAIEDVLGFCAATIGDLSPTAASRFVPSLSYWLRKRHPPVSGLAAVALTSIKTVEAFTILNKAALDSGYPSWMVAAVLEIRAAIDPAAIFEGHKSWLEATPNDANSQLALGAGLSSAASALGASRIAEIIENVRADHSPAVSSMIARLVQEEGLDQLSPFSRIVPSAEASAAANVVLRLTEILKRLAETGDDEGAYSDVSQLLRLIANDQESVEEGWSYIHLFTVQAANKPQGDRFLRAVRAAVFTTEFRTPRRPQARLYRDLQRAYYEAQHKKLDEEATALSKIADHLKEHTGGLWKGSRPSKIRIPTVYYAEEAYLDMLSLLISARFGIEVIRVKDCEWDKLDDAFAANEADIGLNNKDVLARPDASVDEIYKLDAALYQIEDFSVIARSQFVESSGIAAEEVQSALLQGQFLFGEGSEQDEIKLARLIKAGRIGVPRGTLLEKSLQNFAEKYEVPPSQIEAKVSDIGLADFLNGEVQLYFGGRLQTSFALRAHKRVLRVAKLRRPLAGFLFARKQLFKRYGAFCKELGLLAHELKYAMTADNSKYADSRALLLTSNLNKALLEGNDYALALVSNYAELAESLGETNLKDRPPHVPWSLVKKAPLISDGQESLNVVQFGPRAAKK